jgi:cytochrome bd ubiquinol oxidase subunit II
MGILWFWIVAVMITAYVVLDGFDLGAGIVHLFIGKTDEERRKIIRAIGPVWDGNEVWLLAAGGTLYFAYPLLYASSFSGFYLPLMIVLWLLMSRAIGIEFRAHINEPVWKAIFDFLFAAASILLAIFYGAALGNVIRGVPLQADGYFFLPLWTNWRVGAQPGILDWYTVLSGVIALVALAIHGSTYIAVKTEDELNGRARGCTKLLWPVLLVLTTLSLWATLTIRPEWIANYKTLPVAFAIPVLVLASILAVAYFTRKGDDKKAFLASSAYLVLMLVGGVFALFPNVLPASTGAQFNLTIENTKTTAYAMKVGLVWWSIGIVMALCYFVFVYRMFKGKVNLDDGGYGH